MITSYSLKDIFHLSIEIHSEKKKQIMNDDLPTVSTRRNLSPDLIKHPDSKIRTALQCSSVGPKCLKWS